MKFCLALLTVAIHCAFGKNIPIAGEEAANAAPVSCKSVEFDVGSVEFNHYVNNFMRSEVCNEGLSNYNASGRMTAKYLGEEYNYVSHENPCLVVCRSDESVTKNEAPYTFSQYKALPMVELHLPAGTLCGPNHLCDVSGCCSARVVEQPKEPELPEEHKEPETHEEEPKEEEHKEPETHEEEPKEEEHKEDPQVEEHKEEETHEEPKEPHEEEPKEEPKEPEVPEKEYACKEPGVFADDEDETAFFRCFLRSAHVKCEQGFVFNKKSAECEKVLPVETDYEKLITCSQEGYFRNPYDCQRFYRCYFNDESERTAGHLRVGFFKCNNEMVFDSVSHTCVPPERADACNNRLIPHEPVEKEIQAPEFEKILECHNEGYFRNPYDCHLFYRCYYNGMSEDLHKALFACNNKQVFDEVSKNCVPSERTDACMNKQLPAELHYRE